MQYDGPSLTCSMKSMKFSSDCFKDSRATAPSRL